MISDLSAILSHNKWLNFLELKGDKSCAKCQSCFVSAQMNDCSDSNCNYYYDE